MTLSAELLAVLACPEDKGPLLYFGDDGGLYNPRLQRRYLITDGIPIMLIDEAEAVNDEDHAALLAKAESESITLTFEA